MLRWGFVRGAHALQGWMRVSAHSGEASEPAFRHIWIGDDPAKPMDAYTVVEARPFKDGALLRLEGHTGVPAAERWERLKRLNVWVPRDELPALEPDEYYFEDLIGLSVLGPDGHKIGHVERVEERFGQQMTLVIHRGNHRVRVPFHDTWVGMVDLAAGTVALRQEPVTE